MLLWLLPTLLVTQDAFARLDFFRTKPSTLETLHAITDISHLWIQFRIWQLTEREREFI